MAVVAAYSFDGTGTTVADESGNGNGFSLAGTGLVRVTGHTNEGVSNTGSTAATLPSIGQTTSRAVMAWLKGPFSAAAWPIQWYVPSIDSGSWGILMLSGNVHIQARNSTTLARATAAWPTDGQWHHVCGTYDGSNVRLYLDGTLAATTALSGPLRTDATAPTLWGYVESDVMDDLRILSDAPDATAVATYRDTPVGLTPISGALAATAPASVASAAGSVTASGGWAAAAQPSSAALSGAVSISGGFATAATPAMSALNGETPVLGTFQSVESPPGAAFTGAVAVSGSFAAVSPASVFRATTPGSERDITLTVVELGSRWSVTEMPSRWDFREV